MNLYDPKSPMHLYELAVHAALEIDCHRLGRTDVGFENIHELTEILEDYSDKAKNTEADGPFVNPTILVSFFQATEEHSNKKLKRVEEIGLEMKLLSYELRDVLKDAIDPERALDLISYLNVFSSRIEANSYCSYRYRLAG